ncbi:MAG: type 4a pilus biogenesis protein PilO [Proteobacteria bacterium]|nr:type 4a pilus biogenesis protein PilO [Pseudomonadota bacterium]
MKFKPLYIWLAAPVIVVIVWTLAFYMPLLSKTKIKNQELSKLKMEEQGINNDISNMLQIKDKGIKIEHLLKTSQAIIPVLDEFPGVMKDIVMTAKKSGLLITDFNSSLSSIDKKRTSTLIYPTIEIGLKGRFLEMGKFLEELENHNSFKGILNARLSYDEKEYPVLAGIFVIEFKAWKEKQILESK